MAKKIELKTSKNDASVAQYIDGLDSEVDREQARELNELFIKTTNLEPKMWGTSIVGYGEYTYYRANGDEGQFMATGFAMRKSGPVLYIMPGYSTAEPILKRLGNHKLGKSCLYLKRLSDVDKAVLAELMEEGLRELKEKHAVNY